MSSVYKRWTRIVHGLITAAGIRTRQFPVDLYLVPIILLLLSALDHIEFPQNLSYINSFGITKWPKNINHVDMSRITAFEEN
jgi:hypothetical protein